MVSSRTVNILKPQKQGHCRVTSAIKEFWHWRRGIGLRRATVGLMAATRKDHLILEPKGNLGNLT